MCVGEGGVGDERAAAEEVIGGGDVIARFVPVIRQAQQRPVGDPNGNKAERENSPSGESTAERGEAGGRWAVAAHRGLVDRAGGYRDGCALRLDRDDSEGLLILSKVLTEHVPQGLGLLRAKVDAAVVLYRDLIRDLRVRDAEVEGEIPNADADLHAVGVGFPIVRGLDEVDPGLLLAGIHD